MDARSRKALTPLREESVPKQVNYSLHLSRFCSGHCDDNAASHISGGAKKFAGACILYSRGGVASSK